ncbi:MAG: GTPase domain-containing protein [Candidatus Hodarchaeota archaeon]
MVIKVVFLGPPGVGKTSLRKFFFEGESANSLIEHSLPPTKGFIYCTYEHIFSAKNELEMVKKEYTYEGDPFKISVLDAAGQELNKWLDTDAEDVFPEADIIFCVFDASEWLEEDLKPTLQEFVLKVYNKRVELSPDAVLYIIGNKFDKVPKGLYVRKALKASIKNSINLYILNKLNKYVSFDVFITSLFELTYDNFDAITDLIQKMNAMPSKRKKKDDLFKFQAIK